MVQKPQYKRQYLILEEHDKGWGLKSTGKPNGFVKIEARDGKGILEVGISGLKQPDLSKERYVVSLIFNQGAKENLLTIGDIGIDSLGKGKLTYSFNPSDLGGKGLTVADVGAVIIALDSIEWNWMEKRKIPLIAKTQDAMVNLNKALVFSKEENKEENLSAKKPLVADNSPNYISSEEGSEGSKEKQGKVKEDEIYQPESLQYDLSGYQQEPSQEHQEDRLEEYQSEEYYQPPEQYQSEEYQEQKHNQQDYQQQENPIEQYQQQSYYQKQYYQQQEDYQIQQPQPGNLSEEGEVLTENLIQSDVQDTVSQYIENEELKVETDIDAEGEMHQCLENCQDKECNCKHNDAQAENTSSKPIEQYQQYHSAYWDQVKKYLDNTLQMFEEVAPLKEGLESYRWWKIDNNNRTFYRTFLPFYGYINPVYHNSVAYSNDYTRLIARYGHHIFGMVDNEDGSIKYYIYGIPGRFESEDQPYGGSTGFVSWKQGVEVADMGYWLLHIEAKTGRVVIPLEVTMPGPQG